MFSVGFFDFVGCLLLNCFFGWLLFNLCLFFVSFDWLCLVWTNCLLAWLWVWACFYCLLIVLWLCWLFDLCLICIVVLDRTGRFVFVLFLIIFVVCVFAELVVGLCLLIIVLDGWFAILCGCNFDIYLVGLWLLCLFDECLRYVVLWVVWELFAFE